MIDYGTVIASAGPPVVLGRGVVIMANAVVRATEAVHAGGAKLVRKMIEVSSHTRRRPRSDLGTGSRPDAAASISGSHGRFR